MWHGNIFQKEVVVLMKTNALPSSRSVALLHPNSQFSLSPAASINRRRVKKQTPVGEVAIWLLLLLGCVAQAEDSAWDVKQAQTGRGGTPLYSQIVAIPSTDTVAIIDMYVGAGDYQLYYAQGKGTNWYQYFIAACGSHAGGRPDLTVAPDGSTYTAYSTTNAIIVAHYTPPTNWVYEIVCTNNENCDVSIALVPASYLPGAAFGGSGSVRFSSRTATGTWTSPETIDSGFGGMGKPSLLFHPQTGQAIAGYSSTFNGVKVAYQLGAGNWTNVMALSTSFPDDTVLAINPLTGQPAVAADPGWGPIVVSEYDGTKWSTTTVTPWDNWAKQFGFAYSPSGFPIVACQNGMTVELLTRAGTNWVTWSEIQAQSWVFGVDLIFSDETPLVSFLSGNTYGALPRPRLAGISLTNSTLSVSVDLMVPNGHYTIQRAFNLSQANWTNLSTFFAPSSRTNWTETVQNAWSNVFYRVVKRSE